MGSVERQFNWDERFLKLADLVSSWSKDPSTKVGAVIVDNLNRVVSLGYNGFPQKITDDSRLDVREDKYRIIVHAEMNAILFANRSLVGCTLYTVPFLPCSVCAANVIQSGITRVVSYENTIERWKENLDISTKLFVEAGVKVVTYGI
jgi:dCMP deaminase